MNVTVHQDCQNAKRYDDRDGHVPEEMPREEADGTGGQHQGEEVAAPVAPRDVGQEGLPVLGDVVEDVHEGHEEHPDHRLTELLKLFGGKVLKHGRKEEKYSHTANMTRGDPDLQQEKK